MIQILARVSIIVQVYHSGYNFVFGFIDYLAGGFTRLSLSVLLYQLKPSSSPALEETWVPLS